MHNHIHTYIFLRTLIAHGSGPSTSLRGGFLQRAHSPEGYRHAFAHPLAQQKEERAASDQTRGHQSVWPGEEDDEEQ